MPKMVKSKSGIISFHQPLDELHFFNQEELIASHSFSEDGSNGEGNVPDNDFFAINESDSVKAKTRALSKTTVSHNIDFAEGDVLKNSTSMLKGKTLYPNHDMDVNKWVGTVEDTFWSEDDPGIPVPGINANLSVDKKQAPSIARGLLLPSSPVRSVSVTIGFDYRRSHPKMTDRQFWQHFGQDKDSERVRFIATHIKVYKELSFVYAGSDPFANRLSLTDEEYHTLKDNLYEDKNITSKISEMAQEWDSKTRNNATTQSFSEPNKTSIFLTKKLNQDGDNSMDREILCTSLGLPTDASDADIQVALKKQSSQLADLTVKTESLEKQNEDLVTKLEQANNEKEELSKQVEANLEMATLGEGLIKELRENATKLYKLSLDEGEDADKDMLEMIGSASLKSAKSFTKSYKKAAESKLGHKLTDDGTKLEEVRSSGQQSFDEDDKDTKQVIVPGIEGLH